MRWVIILGAIGLVIWLVSLFYKGFREVPSEPAYRRRPDAGDKPPNPGSAPILERCPNCTGKGKITTEEKCSLCHGVGRRTCMSCGGSSFKRQSIYVFGKMTTQTVPCGGCIAGKVVCSTCRGKGKKKKRATCSTCHGTGRKWH